MSVTSVLIDIIGRDKASPAFASAAASADRAAAKLGGTTAKMASVGKKLTTTVTLPVLAIGAASIKTAIDYQKSMTLLQTAGGETAAQVKVIGAGIKAVAVDTGTSLSQLNEGMYLVAKAGASKWAATDQLKVLKAAAQGAKAENVPLASSVDALTSVMTSYNLKASQAVQTENELIRASGLSKTTYAEFAGSLSNVVPIAAALHVSFAQVAGAEATMTQHGESAAQASENLANLLTNLSGQNSVASTAMQQLGINTVDLSKNLGTRGLTGTLAIVEKAIKSHTKNGVVVTDVHKAAALATKSLNEELGTFSGKLKDESTGLLKGTVSIKDYQKYAKSLGGSAGAGALQFLALEKSSLGFSDQLKSGQGTIRTTTTTLQKMLGGVTGMGAVLKLNGQDATLFGRNVKEIGAAAKSSGADVLGWAQTSNTLAVKADKAKASLQVLGLELGTALIPFVAKLVSFGQKAANWFDGLSSGNKKLLVWSVAAVAAIGPVLSILTRLRTLLAFLPGAFARAGTAMASGGGLARAGAGGFVSGAGRGIGLLQTAGVGYLAGGLGTYAAGKVASPTTIGGGLLSVGGGALAGGAAGAAVGSVIPGVGTAVGAAVGASFGAVKGLINVWDKVKSSSKSAGSVAAAALAAQNAAAQDLLGTLQSVGGAYSKQYRAGITSRLDSSGALAIGDKAGLKPGQLTNAVLGTGGPKALAALNVQLENSAAAGKISWSQLSKVQAVIGALAPGALKAEQAFERQAREMGANVLTAGQLGTSLKKLGAATAGTGKSLDTQTAAGVRNNEVLAENVKALNAGATAALKHGKSAKSVAASYSAQINALEANAVKLGFNKQQVDGLIGQYAKVPKSVVTALRQQGIATINPVLLGLLSLYLQIPPTKNTDVNANDNASSTVQFILGQLAQLPSYKSITIGVNHVNTGPGSSTYNSQVPKHAAGTKSLGDGFFTVGESTNPHSWELGRKAGSHVELWSNSESRQMTGWHNVPGFASGTKKSSADTAAIGTAIGTIGQAYAKPIDLASVGIKRIEAQIAHATAVLNAQIHKGLSASAAASFRRQIASLQHEAKVQLGQLKVKIAGADTSTLRTALKGTADEVKAAVEQLAADAAAAGASLAGVHATETRIMGLVNKRNAVAAKLGAPAAAATAYDKLAAAQQDYASARSSASSATSGVFDIASAGQVYQDQRASGGTILASITKLVTNAKAFDVTLKALGKAGLPPALLAQLAQAGPAALPQAKALLASGAGTIKSIVGEYAQLNSTSSDIGKYIADQSQGAGVKTAQGLVDGLKSQQSALNKTITQIADGMVTTLERRLGIKVKKPAAHPAKPKPPGPKKKKSTAAAKKKAEGVHVHGDVHIHGQSDPAATYAAINRRLVHLSA